MHLGHFLDTFARKSDFEKKHVKKAPKSQKKRDFLKFSWPPKSSVSLSEDSTENRTCFLGSEVPVPVVVDFVFENRRVKRLPISGSVWDLTSPAIPKVS